ncbi:MAG: hypothetical protein CMP23_15840 [Rickettsiales bacterium]|nr:hypothetical protein [Rickettsiales bacterium]
MQVNATRRAGLWERRLLGADVSHQQNLVLIDAEPGAEVELHYVQNSESFFVLAGCLRVSAPGFSAELGPGDLCYFPPGTAHGVEVVEGPARFLVVFAPARAVLGPAEELCPGSDGDGPEGPCSD